MLQGHSIKTSIFGRANLGAYSGPSYALSQIPHGGVIKWKHFPRSWPFVRGIHRSSVNSPHKGQWRGALMFSLFSAWINSWVNNRDAGDLRRHRTHYDVMVMKGHHWWWVLAASSHYRNQYWPSFMTPYVVTSNNEFISVYGVHFNALFIQ